MLGDCYHYLVGEESGCHVGVYAVYGAGCLLGDGWVGWGNAGSLGEIWGH